MAEIADVVAWLNLHGIGHVLASQRHGWFLTACGTWTPAGTVSLDRPQRICRKCRARLAAAPAPSAEARARALAGARALVSWQTERDRA